MNSWCATTYTHTHTHPYMPVYTQRKTQERFSTYLFFSSSACLYSSLLHSVKRNLFPCQCDVIPFHLCYHQSICFKYWYKLTVRTHTATLERILWMKSFAIFKMNGTDAYYWLPFDRYQKPTCMQCLYQIETATFMFHLNGYIECFGWHQFGPKHMRWKFAKWK